MDEKLFHARKDTHDPNNPYPDFGRQAAKRTKVPIELLTRKKYCGKSANGKGDKHHILDKSLFPKEWHANYQRLKRKTLRTSMPARPSHNSTRLYGLRTCRESRMPRNPRPHSPNLLATHRIPPHPVENQIISMDEEDFQGLHVVGNIVYITYWNMTLSMHNIWENCYLYFFMMLWLNDSS